MTVEYDVTGQPLSIIDIRPMDLGDILDGTIRVYRRNPWLFVLILTSIIGVPLYVSQIANSYLTGALFGILRVAIQSPGSPETLNAFRSPEFLIPSGVMLVAGIVMFFLAPIATAAMVRAVSETILGRIPTFAETMHSVLPKTGRILLAYLLYISIVLIFFSPFIVFVVIAPFVGGNIGILIALLVLFPISMIFMVFFMIKFLFIPHAVVLDDTGAVQSLRRSYWLTSGYWWRVFGIYVVMLLLVSMISYLLSGAVYLVDIGVKAIPGMTNLIAAAVSGVFMTIISLILNPFTSIATTLLYYDTRIRKEGFDLLLLASSVSGVWEHERVAEEFRPL